MVNDLDDIIVGVGVITVFNSRGGLRTTRFGLEVTHKNITKNRRH